MRHLILPLAGLAGLAMGNTGALAASPAYCSIYAQALTRQMVVEAQGTVPAAETELRAYHRCLNMDDEPQMPAAAFADPGAETGVGGIGGPFVAVDGSSAENGTPDGVSAEQTASASAPKAVAAKPKRRGSGLIAWSVEWRDWCQKHYPNSFNPETGTIIPLETGKRQFCH